MSIATLGKQGAPFDERIFERIEILHARFPAAVISIDGGVSVTNIERLAKAGARRFGVGSAITKAPDPKVAYTQLLALAQAGV
jgi:pentose-5-phosphate-3-epimerase